MQRILTALAAALLLFACDRTPAPSFRITDLRVDYRTTPLGVDLPEPRFSWMMTSDFTNNTKQALTRIKLKEMNKS